MRTVNSLSRADIGAPLDCPQQESGLRLCNAQWISVVSVLSKHLATRARREKQDYRRFIEAVLWVASNRAFWNELPSEYGAWQSTYARYVRWCEADIWSLIIDALGMDGDVCSVLRGLTDQHDEY